MSDSEQHKIIVDDDWKTSARAEKEKLAAKEKERSEQQGAKGPAGIPEQIGFRELLSMLASQALMYMGAFPDESGKAVVHLEIAKLNIDMLDVLEDKTQGNLSDEESTMLTQTLKELRAQFVEVTKAVAKASEDGTLQYADQPGTPGQPPTPPPAQ